LFNFLIGIQAENAFAKFKVLGLNHIKAVYQFVLNWQKCTDWTVNSRSTSSSIFTRR